MWGQAKPMLINDKCHKQMEVQSEFEGSGGLEPLFFHHRRRVRSRSSRAKIHPDRPDPRLAGGGSRNPGCRGEAIRCGVPDAGDPPSVRAILILG